VQFKHSTINCPYTEVTQWQGSVAPSISICSSHLAPEDSLVLVSGRYDLVRDSCKCQERSARSYQVATVSVRCRQLLLAHQNGLLHLCGAANKPCKRREKSELPPWLLAVLAAVPPFLLVAWCGPSAGAGPRTARQENSNCIMLHASYRLPCFVLHACAGGF
jgi:hypothetical protein